MNNIDKPLLNYIAKLTKGHRDLIQINKSEMRREAQQQKLRKFKSHQILLQKLYSTKLENLDEMDDFLDRYHIPKLNQEKIN
jgi:adenine C2-methylase RlmN of 23S rRNA A2503 and tRNA A37